MDERTQARFWAKVEKTETCWLWTASTQIGGYGQFHIDGGTQRTHRLSYEWLVGPVPDGLELDHLCRVRNCVNPAHLQPVTRAENIRRGDGPTVTRARLLARTHCKHGHELTPENIRIDGEGWRRCRICDRIWSYNAFLRRKARARDLAAR